MVKRKYRAMLVEENDSREYQRSIKELEIKELNAGEVLVKVRYSSLNYKDALSASGNKGVTRNYPHTPGIDASGVVEESKSDKFHKGDKVIVTSYDLGMNTAGGFAEYILVPAEWVVPLPSGLSLKEAMAFGTAGFTAGMSVFALTQNVQATRGEILVTGATGGVGSLAIAILAKLGFSVVGVSGKPEAEKFLTELGAKRVISRSEATQGKERPLLATCWAGVVDTVGGDILATAIKSTEPEGVVTCCGNVASPDLPLNVFPFILRGVSLLGIDSQNCRMDNRQKVWTLLANEFKPPGLFKISREVSLEEVDAEINTIFKGGQTGRVLIKI